MPESSFNLFEDLHSSDGAIKEASKNSQQKLAAAVYDVKEKYGEFLYGATAVDEFHDRVALVKNDMMKTVDQHLMPVTGIMRRVVKACKDEWRQRLATAYAGEGDIERAKGFAEKGGHFPIGTSKDLNDAKSVCNFPSVKNKHPGTCSDIHSRETPKKTGRVACAENCNCEKCRAKREHEARTAAEYTRHDPKSIGVKATDPHGRDWRGVFSDQERAEQWARGRESGEPYNAIPPGGIENIAMRKGAPFAGYKDFDECTSENSDKRSPDAYCGKIKHQVEGSREAGRHDEKSEDDWGHEYDTTRVRGVATNGLGEPVDEAFGNRLGLPPISTDYRGQHRATRVANQQHADLLNALDTVLSHGPRHFIAGILEQADRAGVPGEQIEELFRRHGHVVVADKTGPTMDIENTFAPSEGELVPEGDFKGYLNSVDQGAKEKVSDRFEGGDVQEHTGDPAKTNFAKSSAMLAVYHDWCQTNGLRTASLASLDRYAENLTDEGYFTLFSAIREAAPVPAQGTRRTAQGGGKSSADYLGKADEALTNLLNQKAEEFQESVAAFQQALQIIQQAEQQQAMMNPMGVTPPAGSINVLPGQEGGGPGGGGGMAGGGDPVAAAMAAAGAGGGPPGGGGMQQMAKRHDLTKPGDFGSGEETNEPTMKKQPDDWHHRDRGGKWTAAKRGGANPKGNRSVQGRS